MSAVALFKTRTQPQGGLGKMWTFLIQKGKGKGKRGLAYAQRAPVHAWPTPGYAEKTKEHKMDSQTYGYWC